MRVRKLPSQNVVPCSGLYTPCSLERLLKGRGEHIEKWPLQATTSLQLSLGVVRDGTATDGALAPHRGKGARAERERRRPPEFRNAPGAALLQGATCAMWFLSGEPYAACILRKIQCYRLFIIRHTHASTLIVLRFSP